MGKYTEEQLRQAEVWFEKFGKLLQSAGFDLDNPYAMGLVKVEKIPEPSSVDMSDELTDEQITSELKRLEDASSYAFIERKEDGSYANPRQPEQDGIDWLTCNLKKFKDASPELKAYLHEKAQQGALSVGEPLFKSDIRTQHFFVYENPSGELRLTRNLGHLREGIEQLNKDEAIARQDLEIARHQFSALEEEEKMALDGRQFIMEVVSPQEYTTERNRYTSRPEYLANEAEIRSLNAEEEKHPEKTFEITERRNKLYLLRKDLEVQFTSLNIESYFKNNPQLSEEEKQQVLDKSETVHFATEASRKMTYLIRREVSLPEEKKQTVLDNIARQKEVLAQKIQNLSENSPIKQCGISEEIFRPIAIISSCRADNLQTKVRLFDKMANNAKKKQMAIPVGASPEQKEARIDQIRKETREVYFRSNPTEAEHRMCVLGAHHPEWIAEKQPGFFAEELKYAGMPDFCFSGKEILSMPATASPEFSTIMKSLMKLTGKRDLKEIMNSGCVSKPNGESYPKHSTYDFIKEVTHDALHNVLRININGKSDLYKVQPEYGLKPAASLKSYSKAFDSLFQDLRKTDSVFSNDSKEYQRLKKKLAAFNESLPKEGYSYKLEADSSLIAACLRYQQTHAGKPLSDRQQRRLDVINRILQLSSFLKDDKLDPYSEEGLKRQLAEKLVSTISKGLQKGAAEEVGRKMQTDSDQHLSAFRDVYESRAFQNMIKNKDAAGLQQMLNLSERELINRMSDEKKRIQRENDLLEPTLKLKKKDEKVL